MSRRTLPSGIAALALCFGLAVLLPAQILDRYLDTAPADHEDIRLIIFHPEPFNIRAVKTLRDIGILNLPELTVVGVYHTKQRSDFEDSRRYIRENDIDWFEFHAVDAEISEPVLYRRNDCTPEFEKIFEKADGIIFFGGPDLPPAIYGEKTNLLTEISDPYRHFLESSAVFHLFGGLQDDKSAALLDVRPEFPVLGICLGMQTLNVGSGGSLIQDIWSEAYGKYHFEDAISLGPEQWHSNPYRALFPTEKLTGYSLHSLQLGSQSLFCRTMGFRTEDHPLILSAHHQAIERLGKGLVPTATSRDGKIIEAVEHKKYPNVLGVSFHPEHDTLWEAEPRTRFKPGDPPTSFLAVLEASPPSLAFHRKLWSWFAEKLVESRARRSKEGN